MGRERMPGNENGGGNFEGMRERGKKIAEREPNRRPLIFGNTDRVDAGWEERTPPRPEMSRLDLKTPKLYRKRNGSK